MNADLLWLVPALPLVGCIINGAWPRKPRSVSALIGTGCVWLAFLVALYLAFSYISGGLAPRPVETETPFYWFDAGALRLRIGLLLDPLSLVMILIVTGVGGLIHTYSVGYMAEDPGFNRYFCHLNLFTFSMLMLVLGNSFLVLFVGWELVGLCSYLLIGFWYTRATATNAGRKAFIVNRIGDWAFVIGIILTFIAFMPHLGTTSALKFTPVFAYVARSFHAGAPLTGGLEWLPVISILLFIGATGKSAQLPILYVWLPDAMEGPTPVSALIHAATMVTAGVYMVARCHTFFIACPDVMTVVAWVGALTALFAATIGMVQTDIKRVLAYSTISQIGYMFLGAGVGAFSYSIFHLMTHAFFKALLFLGAGAVIHALHNEQDMRKMGGLWENMKGVGIVMGVGVAAIAGFPFTSGFFSKDLILGQAAASNIGLWIVGTLAAFFTAFYMTRLWLMTFWGEAHWRDALQHSDGHGNDAATTGPDAPDVPPEPTHGGQNGGLHVTPSVMMIPMAVLAVLSLVGGALLLNNALPGFLDPVFADMARPVEGTAFAGEYVLYGIATLVFIAGILSAYWAYGRDNTEPKPWMQRSPWLYEPLAKAYGIDSAAHWLGAEQGLALAQGVDQHVEETAIDRVGVMGSAGGIRWIGRQLRHAQTGVVSDYALGMAFGAACLVAYFLLSYIAR